MTRAGEELRRVLEDARSAGYLGPGPVEPHLRHAEGFARAVEVARGREPANFVDLGTGGGIPGLALALRWPKSPGVFVESGRRRCVWLRACLERLDLADRIDVVEDRAEAVGRSEQYREQFEVVTARSFAEPPVTAEIGSGLARIDGIMIVSEPPDPGAGRWAREPLAALGFAEPGLVEAAGAHFAVLHKVQAVPDRYPRGVGRPAKRPLW